MGVIYLQAISDSECRIGLTRNYNELRRMEGDVYAWDEVAKADGPKFLEIATEALEVDGLTTDPINTSAIYASTVIILRVGLFPHYVEKPRGRTKPKPKLDDPDECRDKVLEFMQGLGGEWMTRGRVVNHLRKWEQKAVEKAISVLIRSKSLEMRMQDHSQNGSTIIGLRCR